MIIRQSLVFLLTVALSVFAIQAEAAPIKKARASKAVSKVVAPAEVYAATEEAPSGDSGITAYSQTETEIPNESSAMEFTAPAVVAAPVKPMAQVPTPSVAPAQPVKVAAATKIQKTGTQTFDTVPAQQTESIVRRIRLVEQILIKSGRAYDYRIHTTRELEGILNQLQAASKPVAPRAPVAPRIYDSELPPMTPSADADFS